MRYRCLSSILTPLFLLLGLFLSSCEKSIYSDLTDCPQGLELYFRVVTPCGISYPKTIKEVRVFAFDEEGKLIEEITAKDMALDKSYKVESDFYRPGHSTTFVAWAGSDLATYDFGTLVPGTTTKQEMMVKMTSLAAERPATATPLYYGEPKEGVLKQEDRTGLGSIYDQLHFDLHQLNNRIDMLFHGVDPTHQYDIRFTAQNGQYSILGQMMPDQLFRYTAPVTQEGSILKVHYNTLQLLEGKPYLVEVLDLTDGGKVVYSADLLKDIIYFPSPDTESIRQYLLCNFDFTLKVWLQKGQSDTYVALQAWIANWNIIFRQIHV